MGMSIRTAHKNELTEHFSSTTETTLGFASNSARYLSAVGGEVADQIHRESLPGMDINRDIGRSFGRMGA